MSKVNVLVLNDFTRDNRVLKTARSLHKAGHEVRVLALWRPGLPEREQLADGVQVVRLRSVASRLPGGKLTGLIKAMAVQLQLIVRHRDADVMHCNDLEAFVLGVILQRFQPGLKLIYDCHEFEAERNAQPNWMRRGMGAIERAWIRRASAVLTVSPSILRAYEERYGKHGLPPTYLVRNIPHRRNTSISHSEAEGFSSYFSLPEGAWVALYQGAFTWNRGLEVAIEAAKALREENIHLVLMGYGPLQPLVDAAAAEYPNIHYMPAVPYDSVLAWTQSADVGLVSVDPVCLSYLYCLPNKLFEYILAGIPVLSNHLPDCAALIEAWEVGEVVSENNARGWAAALRQMRDQPEGKYAAGLALAAENLHWEGEEEQLYAAYRSAGVPMQTESISR
ncbi:MAG: hypothetical protein RJA19_1412 [Bacteroidota bacterium]|jgi:glycosyltransferase involved in cell wall biosynthesis